MISFSSDDFVRSSYLFRPMMLPTCWMHTTGNWSEVLSHAKDGKRSWSITSPTKLLVPKDQQIICSYLFSLLPSMNCPQTRRWLLCYSAWTSYDGRSWTTPQSGSLRDCRNALAMIYPYPARWMWREMIQSELSQDNERRSLSGPFSHFIQAEKWHSTIDSIDEQFGQLLFSS